MNSIFISLAIVLGLGKIISLLFERLKLPAVIGEILAGLFLGNLFLISPNLDFDPSRSSFLRELSELGVVLMLFGVGLESSFSQILKTGGRAFLVATVGVLAPFFLTLLLWKLQWLHLDRAESAVFLGATLAATSIGITARILGASGRISSKTGQIIIGAAVIDDVLGLLILAGVSSFVVKNTISAPEIFFMATKAGLFFALALGLGWLLFPRLLKNPTSLVTAALCSCFFMAFLSSWFGLAPIVGSFFAGLFIKDEDGQVRHPITPIVQFLSPLFFVLIGAQIKLGPLFSMGWDSLLKIVLLFVVGLLGKFLCGFVSGRDTDRIAVGLGMAPRGEVGLIFAATGKQLGVLGEAEFAIVVFVVLLTTLIPGILLEKYLKRSR